MTICMRHIESPVGRLLLATGDDGLRCVEFDDPRHPVRIGDDWVARDHPLIDATRQQLHEYFAGTRRTFDLPLAARGTAFQQRVWRALCGIAYGATCSYADIARALTEAQQAGEPDAAAVARVRSRLLRRIADDSIARHTAIPAEADGWHRFLPGIRRKVLHEAHGVMSYLLRFEPGAVLPAHRHPVDEECVVIEGSLRIGPLQLGPGGFHRVTSVRVGVSNA